MAPGSRFPIEKYARLREKLCSVQVLSLDFLEAPAISLEELEFAHHRDYIDRVLQGRLSVEEQRLLGFPWSDQLVARARRSAGGTLAACRAALNEGVAVNLAGGTHHAKMNAGAGYCVFNDVAVAARVMSQKHEVERVLIVDADVHQGDGTAAILQPFSSLYTFSIHAEGNYPRKKTAGDLDIALPDGTGDADYLRNFRDGLERAFIASRPKLVIYLAGADPYVDDRLGRLNLSKEGLKHRDQMVNDQCRLSHTPLAIAMAGGYAPNIEDIVDIHYQTVALAAALHAKRY